MATIGLFLKAMMLMEVRLVSFLSLPLLHLSPPFVPTFFLFPSSRPSDHSSGLQQLSLYKTC